MEYKNYFSVGLGTGIPGSAQRKFQKIEYVYIENVGICVCVCVCVCYRLDCLSTLLTTRSSELPYYS